MYRFSSNKKSLCFEKSVAYSLHRYDICHFYRSGVPEK